MINPEIPKNEEMRLISLKSFSILDTLPEEDYENITAIAAEICDTPISLISLIDENRQWFKSRFGLLAPETPRSLAFCAHAINDPDSILIVPDARKDDRFRDNPLVEYDPHVIFYAGVPLKDNNGLALGTLCVIDNKPKKLTSQQLNSLKALSKQVMNLLELRKTKNDLNKSLEEMGKRNVALEKFASLAAHDIKSPLNNISSLVELFIIEHADSINEEGLELIQLIAESSEKLRSLVDGLLNYSLSEKKLKMEKETFHFKSFIRDLEVLLPSDSNSRLVVNTEQEEVTINKTALQQIFLNLISNAIKYNDKPVAEIEVGHISGDKSDLFYVQDNGPGITSENHNTVFELFSVLAKKDKFGNEGTGLGLATVKKLVTGMGGEIHIESTKGAGCKFIITLPK